MHYPADPPTVEEIVAVMRCAGDTPHGLRTRALVVVLWRAGLRISEALSLAESDLDPSRGSILVRAGKGGKRREVEMAREGVPLNVIQRQLGHANLGITSIYLQGIDSSEIINTHPRAPRAHAPRERWPPLTEVVHCSSDAGAAASSNQAGAQASRSTRST